MCIVRSRAAWLFVAIGVQFAGCANEMEAHATPIASALAQLVATGEVQFAGIGLGRERLADVAQRYGGVVQSGGPGWADDYFCVLDSRGGNTSDVAAITRLGMTESSGQVASIALVRRGSIRRDLVCVNGDTEYQVPAGSVVALIQNIRKLSEALPCQDDSMATLTQQPVYLDDDIFPLTSDLADVPGLQLTCERREKGRLTYRTSSVGVIRSGTDGVAGIVVSIAVEGEPSWPPSN